MIAIPRKDMPTAQEGCANLSQSELQEIILKRLHPEKSPHLFPGYVAVDFENGSPIFFPGERAFNGRDHWSYGFEIILAGGDDMMTYALMTCGGEVEFSWLRSSELARR